MKKSKLLAALLLCMTATLPLKAYSYDQVFSGTYENINEQSRYYGAGMVNPGESAIVKAGAQFINNQAYRAAGIYNNRGTLTVEDGVNFNGNQALTAAGGAIQNFGTATLGHNLVFENNEANWGGAAIYAGSNRADGHSTTIGSGAVFRNNTLTSNDSYGGAIFVENDMNASSVTFNIGSNSLFDSNKAKQGGAIYIKDAITATIAEGANFTNNTATDIGGAIYNAGVAEVGGSFTNNSAKQGGAIYNANDLTVASGSNFENNHSTITGSAISNYADKLVIGDNVSFKDNISLSAVNISSGMSQMGTIYSEGTASRTNNIEIGDNVLFEGNKAGGGAGLYLMGANDVTIGDGAKFINNSTQALLNDTSIGGAGGAITVTTYTNPSSGVSSGHTELEIGDNATFENNKAAFGGAIAVADSSASVLLGKNAQFVNNSATGPNGFGGAIYNTGDLGIQEGAIFSGNKSDLYGGAIYNWNGTIGKIVDATFENNSSKHGGAIISSSALDIQDSSFINNTATGVGGAILAYSDVKISAVDKDVIFSGNSASSGSDIYMNTAGSRLILNAADGKTIKLEGGIAGDNNNNTNNYQVIINDPTATVSTMSMFASPSSTGGTVVINSAVHNATMNVANGTLHLAEGSALTGTTSLNMAGGTTLNTIDNQVNTFGSNVTLADNTTLMVDLDLATGQADNYASAGVGNIKITEINPLGNTTANNVTVNLIEAMGLDPNAGNVTISQALQNQTQTVLTPIRYLQGSVSSNGLLTMAPAGNSYKDFNPAVMASSVAAQLGGYLTQLNSYDQAFRNMDMYMLMTKKQRQALKFRNKYAAADGNLVFAPLGTQYDDKAVWFRPYASFENVPLKNGPRVSNVAYGSFFGADSELHDLGHGWDGMLSVYAGYNGSHQAYDGISVYQNGGTLGLTGVAYKGNFFTGITLNAGANAGEANTAYGHDNFSMLMAGIANKTGYNIELADGKFIIQPNLQLSYSFVNTFDYRNAAGVKINADPLHAIQVEPGIKFIGNLKNGWQPYAGISVVGNIMDQTNFRANNVSLPELSVKPYVRYGIGVRKTWGEICSGFLQTYFTNGGRNGVGLQAGFRFTLGKGGFDSIKANDKLPEMPKTKITLKGVK